MEGKARCHREKGVSNDAPDRRLGGLGVPDTQRRAFAIKRSIGQLNKA
jgi:hypothetical protein